MMGRGASIDPQTFAERQRMADLMYQRSLVPAQNESSWTQGMARMLQGGIAGYDAGQVQKERELYKEQKRQDMQKLGAALGSGDYKSILGQLNDPDTQMMALQLAKSDMDRINKLNADRQLEDYKFKNQRTLKKDDFGRQLDLENMKSASQYDLEWLKSNNRMLEKRDEKMADPVKEVQSRIANYSRVINDPNAPQSLKLEAQKRIEAEKLAMGAMKPPSSSVNIDMGAKGEGQMEKEFGGALGKEYAETQIGNIKAGLRAVDQLATYDRMVGYIEDGTLGNLQTTELGQGLSKAASRLGLPNSSGQIADFVQATNQQLVDMRKLLAGQGQISNYEQSLLKNTAVDANDTLEAIRNKLFVFKQLANRVKLLGEITTQWKDKYGSVIRKGPDGKSFDSAVKALYDATPLISYDDYMKSRQEEASRQAGVQQ